MKFSTSFVTAVTASCLLALIAPAFSIKLEKVDDTEFLKLVQTEKFVIALFSKPNCGEACDKAEHELALARESLVDSMNAWVVKLESSPLAKLYTPNKEPAIVFFRHGNPLLYHGEYSEDEILSIFQRNQDPVVKELNDQTFEHLTQAATGATTGDWLVMFYKQSCVTSQRLQAVWEAVGAALKGRINVARVDKSGAGAVTGRRFNVGETPAFVLFRHGKMYKYELDSLTVPNFIDFATDFYRNSKATPIPPPKSPFDDFTEMVVEKMKDNPQYVKLGSIITAVLIVLAVLNKLRGSAQQESRKKQ